MDNSFLSAQNIDNIYEYINAEMVKNHNINLDGDRVYEQFNMTVYGDEKMKIRQQVEAWMLAYNNPITNTGKLVKTEAFVTVLNRDGTSAVKFLMHGCILTSAAAVTMDWGTNDTPMEFDVTIDYDYHIVLPK